ncbi:MAG: hypothetical protein K2R98_18625 [Gemmataceae bacterium]|nr:hypothetical protein [Gemmataceae bacterium]
MSEYQVVSFRAIDGPVSEKNLEYMHQQSSRAEITAWSFDNEYHYGDFRGNAHEMLRRGYDIHLHYANFGVRTLMIRLPNGLPDPKAAAPYLGDEAVEFVKDKQGAGGILSISPFHEPGDLEELWELDDILERLLPLRAEILDGDLRPLYLAHLAIASDDQHDPEETTEAPVPAGLGKLSKAQLALAELYGLGEALLTAAAAGALPLPDHSNPRTQYDEWLQGQPAAIKDEWLLQLLTDSPASARTAILTEFRRTRSASSWPTVQPVRTIAELKTAAEGIQEAQDRKRTENAARQRAKRLAGMAADPVPTLRETEKLVAERGSDAYRKVAVLLAQLREATAGTKHSGLAEKQAQKLRSKNPTLRVLVSELRREGFLPK